MTEKETGNAQPGACVDVLPRCLEDVGRNCARGNLALVVLISTAGHFAASGRHSNDYVRQAKSQSIPVSSSQADGLTKKLYRLSNGFG